MTAECDIVGPGRVPGTRKRQTFETAGATAVNNYKVHIGDNISNNVFIIVGDELGDLIKAGTVTEEELIRRTILENPDLRRQVRTIENIPAAVFRLTKGKDGPRRMRNVQRHGRKIEEYRQDGKVTHTTTQYCKDTAVKMVEQLQHVIRSVDDTSPVAVQEWAREVARELREPRFGKYDFPTVLKLYKEASSAFYKIPQEARDTISASVSDIAMFIT